MIGACLHTEISSIGHVAHVRETKWRHGEYHDYNTGDTFQQLIKSHDMVVCVLNCGRQCLVNWLLASERVMTPWGSRGSCEDADQPLANYGIE